MSSAEPPLPATATIATTGTTIRHEVEGCASDDHDSAVAELVLRGLGVPLRRARMLSRRPLTSGGEVSRLEGAAS